LVHAAPDAFIDGTMGPGMEEINRFLSQPDDLLSDHRQR
jgi:hypothetical protein